MDSSQEPIPTGDADNETGDPGRAFLTPVSQSQMEAYRTAHQTQVLTVLLTDLVGSTQSQTRLGNIRAAQLVRAHRDIFRGALKDFDGEEIETAGDSFLAVFAAPSEGVRFALHVQEAMRRAHEAEADLPLMRIGLHQGQVVVERHADGGKPMDIYGLQVSMAARISDLAGGGQILCSRSVFDDARAILRGEDLQPLGTVAWLNHGPYRFKGVDDPHEVCEVGVEGTAPLAAPPAGTKSWPADLPEEELGWRPAAGVTVPGTNWQLEERLGEESSQDAVAPRFAGEFGEVWKAWNPTGRSHQVFKFCFRRDRIPVLKREARLLKRLRHYRHPGLVDVYDVTAADQPPYYLEMEYVAGPSLADWGAAGPTLDERLEVIAQVAEALDTVHAAGIYHRDIKPSNILLTHREDGVLQAKLTDFGLGATEDEELLHSVYLSRVDGIAGTWDYIAPELREGKPPSAQSDIYSLGVTLYQVVVGDLEAPLAADWQARLPTVILCEDVRRCVLSSPDERWRRVGDLAVALRSHNDRLRARQLEQEQEAQRQRLRRVRLVSAVAALFALVVLGFGGFATLQWRAADRQRKRAERARADAEDLVHFMLGGLYEQLMPLTTLKVMDEVTSKAADYFESLPPGQASEASRAQHARALRMCGEVCSAQRNPDAAGKFFKAALAILEPLQQEDQPGDRGELDLFAAYRGLGRIQLLEGNLDGALEHFQAGLDVAERLLAQGADEADARSRLAFAHMDVGNVLGARGDADGWRKHRDASGQHMQWLADNLPEKAVFDEMVAMFDDLPAALTSSQPVTESPFQLIGAYAALGAPGVAPRLRNVARRCRSFGLELARTGDTKAALEQFNISLVILQHLLGTDPDDGRWQADLVTSHKLAGDAVLAQGDGDGALAHFAAGLAFLQAMLKKTPNDPDCRQEHSVMQARVGRALMARGATTGGLKDLRQALDTAVRLTKTYPDSISCERLLADQHVTLGTALCQAGDTDGAIEHCRAGLVMWQQQAADDPDDHTCRHRLASAHRAMAAALTAKGEPDEAAQHLDQAKAILQNLVETSPDHEQ